MKKLLVLGLLLSTIVARAEERAGLKAMTVKQITEYTRAISQSKDHSQRTMLEMLKANYIRNALSAGVISSSDVREAEKAALHVDDELFLSDLKDLERELRSLPGLSRDKRNSALYVLEAKIKNLRKNGSPEKVNAILEQNSENRIFRCTELAFNSDFVFCSDNFICKKSSTMDTEELAGYPQNVRQILLSRLNMPAAESENGAH